MKIFRILFFMALLGSGLTACQKEDAKSMAGTWEGAWGFGEEVPTNFERWEFKSNGDFSAYGLYDNLYAKGVFNVNGIDFTAEYTSQASGSKYSFKGEYDETLQTITGTWGLSPSVTNRGHFEMSKQ